MNKTKPLADRVANIKPFAVMTLLEAALKKEALGNNIIHFEIGEPDFDTPQSVQNAAITATTMGKTHYTHSLGILPLREAIANYRQITRNQQVFPENIIVTAGSSAGFLMVCGTLVNPGDEVIITDPGYPCYQNFIQFFGGKVVFLEISEQDGFIINPQRLREKITPKTKAIIINSPANPTGQIIPISVLSEIKDIVIEHGIYLISDEIYGELTYNNQIAPSPARFTELQDQIIVLDGFSKLWAMTGWRIGFLTVPPTLLEKMNRINQNFMICAPSVGQYAALEALKNRASTRKMREEYAKRRELVLKRIDEIEGLSIVPPNGAFYAFCNISELSSNSEQFAWDLLDNANVAATPGSAFGPNGESFIRFSYCTTTENILEGFLRVEKYIRKM